MNMGRTHQIFYPFLKKAMGNTSYYLSDIKF
jgi:hypothetical protein